MFTSLDGAVVTFMNSYTAAWFSFPEPRSFKVTKSRQLCPPIVCNPTALRLCQNFFKWGTDGPTVYTKPALITAFLADTATDVSQSLNLDLSGFLYRALGPQHSVFIMITVQWGPNNNQMLTRLQESLQHCRGWRSVIFMEMGKNSVFSP